MPFLKYNKSFFDFILKKLLAFTLFFFIFFPYLEFIKIGSDLQPYSLLFSLLISLIYSKNIYVTKFEILFFILMISSIFISSLNYFNFNSLRSVYNYTSLFFITYSTTRILKSKYINFQNNLEFFFWIWTLVCVIQFLYNPLFLTSIISDSRTTIGRGIVGLSPEPSYLGIIYLFFILYFLLINHKNKIFYISISIIIILFFAMSSMAALFLFIMLILWLLLNLKFKTIFYSILFISISLYFIFKMEDSRIGSITYMIINNPKDLLLLDASINDRFFNIYFSIKGTFDNYFLPNGFNKWLNYVNKESVRYIEYFNIDTFSKSGRIMSGFGAAFFELGFISFLIPIYLYKNLSFYLSKKDRIFHFGTLFLIMLTAIPIGFPFFALYISLLQSYDYNI